MHSYWGANFSCSATSLFKILSQLLDLHLVWLALVDDLGHNGGGGGQDVLEPALCLLLGLGGHDPVALLSILLGVAENHWLVVGDLELNFISFYSSWSITSSRLMSGLALPGGDGSIEGGLDCQKHCLLSPPHLLPGQGSDQLKANMSSFVVSLYRHTSQPLPVQPNTLNTSSCLGWPAPVSQIPPVMQLLLDPTWVQRRRDSWFWWWGGRHDLH